MHNFSKTLCSKCHKRYAASGQRRCAHCREIVLRSYTKIREKSMALAARKSDEWGIINSDYRETAEFTRYRRAIEQIFAASDAPVTVGEIHRQLGESVRREWTMDALDQIGVIEIGAAPIRYQIAARFYRRPVSWASGSPV